MSSYAYFARFYDSLTRNVDYAGQADYLEALCQSLAHSPGLTLDLACGTGSLTVELAKRGWDIYGIDGSPEMLSEAMGKASDAGLQILFLCQKMQNIDLYGTVDTVLCTLDSINHLACPQEVQKTFERVSLFLNPGGYFIFDTNTVYKHREVLGNHTFVYDTRDVYCVWQNTYEESRRRVAIQLDFFEKDGAVYSRHQENFAERAYSPQEIETFLNQAGLSLIRAYEEKSFHAPGPKAQRVVYAAQKPGVSADSRIE